MHKLQSMKPLFANVAQLMYFLVLCLNVVIRDVEAEAEAGSGSGPFSMEAEAEARKFHRFRFHIGGKNGRRKKIGSAILRRRANCGSIIITK